MLIEKSNIFYGFNCVKIDNQHTTAHVTKVIHQHDLIHYGIKLSGRRVSTTAKLENRSSADGIEIFVIASLNSVTPI